jgi:hypothetical protein
MNNIKIINQDPLWLSKQLYVDHLFVGLLKKQ